MKRYSAIIALMVWGLMSIYMMPVQAASTSRTNYDHMVNLRFKEKWLLPPVQLSEGEATWVFDFNRRLRPFSSGQIARDINKADLTFLGSPFGPDVLKNRDQARALVQLGMLAQMGHFAVINSNNENVKAGAVSIINQLAEVADHFKIGNLASQYQRLATDVADPKFMGGPSPIVQRYDATVAALFDAVANSFGVDGHWYFMFGNDIAGLYVLSLHQDQLHSDYYESIANDLFHTKPVLFPDIYTRAILRDISSEPTRDSAYLAGVTAATMNHYLASSNYYVSPRRPHFDNYRNRVEIP